MTSTPGKRSMLEGDLTLPAEVSHKHSSDGSSVHPLRDSAEAKGARVVTSPEGATHTIGPDPAGTLAVETADTNALRELERKQEASEGKTMCRVHWWYYPDSCTSPPPAQCLFAGNP